MAINIEDNAKRVYKRIDYCDLDDKRISMELSELLEVEYNKIKKSALSEKQKRFHHYNYYYCNAIWIKQNECSYSEILHNILLSTYYILLQPNPGKIDNQLRKYGTFIGKIDFGKSEYSFHKCSTHILGFLNKIESKEFKKTLGLVDFIRSIIVVFFMKILDIKENNLKRVEELISKLESIISKYDVAGVEKTFTSELHTFIFWLNKKKLFLSLRNHFSSDKSRNSELPENDILTKNKLIKHSKSAKKYCDPKSIVNVFLKEVDVIIADYLECLYFKKNLIKAYNLLDKLRCRLIEAFYQDLNISKPALDYFNEEWAFVSLYIKTKLFDIEISRLQKMFNQKWQNELSENLQNKLIEFDNQIKFNLNNNNFYLRISPGTLEGDFSEFLIHSLIINLWAYYINSDIINMHEIYKHLFDAINQTESIDKIILNDQRSEPDIDINVNNKCAILLKNSRNFKFESIKKEIIAAERIGVSEIYYGFNFIKAINEIKQISEIKKMINNSPDINSKVIFVDISDLVKVILEEISVVTDKKHKMNINDLVKVLGY